MLATGNLPGLTAPGEGARAIGYFMESVVPFRCKRGKLAEKVRAELPVVSHRLLGKKPRLEVPF